MTKRNTPFGRAILQKNFQVSKSEYHRKSFLFAVSDFQIRILKANKNIEHVMIVDLIDVKCIRQNFQETDEEGMWRYVLNLILYDKDTDQIMPFGHCLIQDLKVLNNDVEAKKTNFKDSMFLGVQHALEWYQKEFGVFLQPYVVLVNCNTGLPQDNLMLSRIAKKVFFPKDSHVAALFKCHASWHSYQLALLQHIRSQAQQGEMMSCKKKQFSSMRSLHLLPPEKALVVFQKYPKMDQFYGS